MNAIASVSTAPASVPFDNSKAAWDRKQRAMLSIMKQATFFAEFINLDEIAAIDEQIEALKKRRVELVTAASRALFQNAY